MLHNVVQKNKGKIKGIYKDKEKNAKKHQ